MKTVAFIYKNKCHPVSQSYAEAIDAVPYKITGPMDGIWKGLTIQTYKYYFIESAMSMLVPVIKRLLGKKVHIVFRGNDGLFGEKTTAYLHTKNPVKKAFLLFLINQMDGIIVESEMTKKDAQHWIKKRKEKNNVPIEVCESYVENKEELEKIKPKLDTKTFLFIGEYRPPYDHKNIEFLLKIFADLPEYELVIIGKNTRKLQKKAPKNVHILDYVKNTEEWYKQATWYIHLPKYETGPITLLEAITAGLIPITNSNAGHHILVKKVAEELVFDGNPPKEEIEKKIKAIIAIQQQKRRKISETFKKLGKNHFNKEEMGQKFQHVWDTLMEKMKEK